MKKNIIITMITVLFLSSCDGFDDDNAEIGETNPSKVDFVMTRAQAEENQTFGFYAYRSEDTTIPDGLQPANLNNGWGTYYYTSEYPAMVPCIVDPETGDRTTDYNVANAMEISYSSSNPDLYFYVSTPGLPMEIYDGYYQIRYSRATPFKTLSSYCYARSYNFYQIFDLSSFFAQYAFVEQRAKFSFRFIQGAGSPIEISDCYVLNAGTYAYLHPNTKVITITGQSDAGSNVPFGLVNKNNSTQGQVSYASHEDGSQDVYLFPSDYTSTHLSDLRLSFRLKIGDDPERLMELPISMVLQANNRYVFKITVSTQFITLTCQNAEWDAQINQGTDVGKHESFMIGTFAIADWENGGENTDII